MKPKENTPHCAIHLKDQMFKLSLFLGRLMFDGDDNVVISYD